MQLLRHLVHFILFSGKSTLACSLSRKLHSRGKLSYVLDGDNLRHGLNKDLGFSSEDRKENICRVGEVAKLFADAGMICIASLISRYRKDRDACHAMLQDGRFIEVFMNMPSPLCESRDCKGLYKFARARKIKGFTGIDDPYEPPLNCEIEIQEKDGVYPTPIAVVGQVVSYLEDKGFLHYSVIDSYSVPSSSETPCRRNILYQVLSTSSHQNYITQGFSKVPSAKT